MASYKIWASIWLSSVNTLLLGLKEEKKRVVRLTKSKDGACLWRTKIHMFSSIITYAGCCGNIPWEYLNHGCVSVSSYCDKEIGHGAWTCHDLHPTRWRHWQFYPWRNDFHGRLNTLESFRSIKVKVKVTKVFPRYAFWTFFLFDVRETLFHMWLRLSSWKIYMIRDASPCLEGLGCLSCILLD